jgi:hypothetical protein
MTSNFGTVRRKNPKITRLNLNRINKFDAQIQTKERDQNKEKKTSEQMHTEIRL